MQGRSELRNQSGIEARGMGGGVNVRRIRAVPADRAGREARFAEVVTLAALVGVLAMLASTSPARAALYKWVDDKGVVHYTDTLPPEAVDKARIELNKQGVEVKKTDKALTPDQRRAIEREAQKQKENARQQEEVARRDRALLSTYTSEAEIDLARKRSLQTIDNIVQSTLAYSGQLSKRKVELETKKEEMKGKPTVAVIDRELESIEAELARQAELIEQKKRETQMVVAKYDADKVRWRELVAARAAENAKPVATPDTAPRAPGKR